VEVIRSRFSRRGWAMPESNLRQADVPEGCESIPNPMGTAPGLICEVGSKVIYAVPGVPYEMEPMVSAVVLPDLLERSGERSTIVSRVLKTWGAAESGLTNPTIAFLARGIEGIVVRITAKANSEAQARALIEAEETALRADLGDLIFGVDEETMETAVIDGLRRRGWTLGVAESLTGGLVGARLTAVTGGSDVFRGSVASYATEVKRTVLGVTAERVVSDECARQMAEGARRVLGSDVGIAVTGVAGPDDQDGEPPGTVHFGLALPGQAVEAVSGRLPGDRERVRQFSTISLLNLLRLRLEALEKVKHT
jgi:nicotinamide-nucleotide amidase